MERRREGDAVLRISAMTAIVLAASGVTPAAPQTCRPTALGSVACPVPRPEPRPVLEADTQALERVRRAIEADERQPGFVPARRTDRLGSTRAQEPDRPVSRCRPDRLGNLNCR